MTFIFLYVIIYLVIIMDELKKYGENIYVNDYEICVLNKCNIDVSKCKTLAEVLLLIDRYLDDANLDDEEYDEIDYVANNLNERLYYMGNK